MKIALYQGAGKPARVDENLEIIHRKAFSAAGQGADLIIFPELFLSGYNIGQTVQELAEQADDPACQKAARIAREADIAKNVIAAERETNPVLKDLRPDLYARPVKKV